MAPVSFAAPELEVTMSSLILPYTTDRSRVRSRTGQMVPVIQPLVMPHGRPHTGWTIRLNTNGQRVNFTGNHPLTVVKKVFKFLEDNSIKYSKLDVWLNLNIQWLNRTSTKYQNVLLQDLMEIATPTTPASAATAVVDAASRAFQAPEPTALPSFPPSDWGRIGWEWLNLILTQEDYMEEEFLMHLDTVGRLLDPQMNPITGCAECDIEFQRKRRELAKGELNTKEAARRWLWAFHNSVNKRLDKAEITFETATKLYKWA